MRTSAPDRAVIPEQTVPRSSTSTSTPRSARWKAIEQPMTPPPTTTTLAPAAMPAVSHRVTASMHGMPIKVISDIHGAADALRREAAGADALLVCGDLVNLIDYRTMQGIAADVFGPEVTREFVAHRTAGRFEEAGRVLRGAAEGREDQVRAQVRVAARAQYEAVFAAFPEPTYLTHGNVDDPGQFQDLLRPGVRHLDGESVELDGLRVGFAGGGLPRGPRPQLGERSHEELAARVARVGP